MSSDDLERLRKKTLRLCNNTRKCRQQIEKLAILAEEAEKLQESLGISDPMLLMLLHTWDKELALYMEKLIKP